MDDQFVVTCPFCGEHIEIYVEPDVTGDFVQDCEVCCNPWRVRVSRDGEIGMLTWRGVMGPSRCLGPASGASRPVLACLDGLCRRGWRELEARRALGSLSIDVD